MKGGPPLYLHAQESDSGQPGHQDIAFCKAYPTVRTALSGSTAALWFDPKPCPFRCHMEVATYPKSAISEVDMLDTPSTAVSPAFRECPHTTGGLIVQSGVGMPPPHPLRCLQQMLARMQRSRPVLRPPSEHGVATAFSRAFHRSSPHSIWTRLEQVMPRNVHGLHGLACSERGMPTHACMERRATNGGKVAPYTCSACPET